MSDIKKNQEISAEDAAKLAANEKKNGRLPKMLVSISVAVIVIVGAILAYIYLVREPGMKTAAQQAGKVDVEYIDKQANDSIVAEMAAQAAKNGYKEGNRMHLVAAISYYNMGDYEKCLAQLNDFDAKDDVVGAAAMSLKGDALVNLDRYEEATKAFKEAIDQSDNNPEYTPIFMSKLARVYRAMDKINDELAVLRDIKSHYPVYADQNYVEAYIVRAEEQTK